MIKRPDINASCMMHASPDGTLVTNPSAVKASVVAPLMENPHVVKPPSDGRRSRAVNNPPRSPALHGGAQVALDLELGS
jgi:hypothetical protein